MKHLSFFRLAFIALFFASSVLKAQIPAGYYDSAWGLTGTALKQELHNIISNGFSSISYDDLWTAYQTTDVKENGKVWDMYSDVPGGTSPYEYTFNIDECGNYSVEGDCFNREHTVPQSWFNSSSPMVSDIFHVVPTDGKVNGQRSNYPYGEVGTTSWTSLNGSKLGTCNFPGYTGTVFEPIDSFKGDFARIYFYMCVRYKDEMSSWTGESFSGGDLSSWAENLFLSWNALDPVSEKERDRNNTVYAIQHNRNPFVDNPDWVLSIWGPTAGITNQNENINVSIFPNPSSGSFDIVVNKVPERIAIVDLTGREIWSKDTENNERTSFSEGFLQAGVYYVVVTTNGAITSTPLIISE